MQQNDHQEEKILNKGTGGSRERAADGGPWRKAWRSATKAELGAWLCGPRLAAGTLWTFVSNSERKSRVFKCINNHSNVCNNFTTLFPPGWV